MHNDDSSLRGCTRVGTGFLGHQVTDLCQVGWSVHQTRDSSRQTLGVYIPVLKRSVTGSSYLIKVFPIRSSEVIWVQVKTYELFQLHCALGLGL